MIFTPKTEEEMQMDNLLPAGIYDFEIIDASEKISKAGNEMIELEVGIFDGFGIKRRIRDWLMGKMPHKLRCAADACELIDAYEMGLLNANAFIGKCGKLHLGIKQDDPQFAPRNYIKNYVKRADMEKHMDGVVVALSNKADDDEIPF